jgi:hypothetical protein
VKIEEDEYVKGNGGLQQNWLEMVCTTMEQKREASF